MKGKKNEIAGGHYLFYNVNFVERTVMIITTKAYARAGLVGNPSDGYFGKTIAFTFSNFYAEITLYQSPELEIVGNRMDNSSFSSVKRLVNDVRNFGYYGGIRLLKATVKKFAEYCEQNKIALDERNFTIRYKSNIPHRVGLAGSSAIITACMRALMAFYQVTIPKPALASLILSVEKEELNISAGLQDRVVQVYEGVVFMDFRRDLMESQGHGIYENLEIDMLPNLYIAYLKNISEGSEIFHNNIRERFELGDVEVVEAMQYWADLALEVKNNLESRNKDAIGDLLNKNFDRRQKIYKISEQNLEMVRLARSVGASAKFSGSGGAIVGVYESEKMFTALHEVLTPLGIEVLKPNIISTHN